MYQIVKMFFVAAVALAFTTPIALAADKEVCKLTITGNDQMQYDLKKMTVSKAKCSKVEVTLKHIGKMAKKVMGHNWVVVATPDLMPTVQASMAAGPAKDYLPDDKAKILAYTKMLGGGESDTVSFDLSKFKAGGDYTFFCSFPGHFGTMQGKFIVEK